MCIYCATPLSKENRTKEHVIGRRFVPKGTLSGGWNLIAFACLECNRKKSRLEDELAAISMQPDLHGKFAVDHEVLKAEAARKATNSFSSRTKRPISESNETLTYSLEPSKKLKIVAEFEAGAQISDRLTYTLCSYQTRAFFFLMTYDESTRSGKYWRGVFMGVNSARRADWGNVRQTSFATKVHAWEPRLLTRETIADGFAKAAIRKHPDEACWSWALEWNHNFRSIGFFGDESVCESLAQSLERLNAQLLVDMPDFRIARRVESRLNPDDDVLFEYEMNVRE